MIPEKKKGTIDFRSFIIWWNNTYPLDLWWRNKYKVAFGSEAHRSMVYSHIRFEYEEEKIVEEYTKKEEKFETDDKELNSFINKEDETKVVKMSDEDIEKEFNSIDLTKISHG